MIGILERLVRFKIGDIGGHWWSLRLGGCNRIGAIAALSRLYRCGSWCFDLQRTWAHWPPLTHANDHFSEADLGSFASAHQRTSLLSPTPFSVFLRGNGISGCNKQCSPLALFPNCARLRRSLFNAAPINSPNLIFYQAFSSPFNFHC